MHARDPRPFDQLLARCCCGQKIWSEFCRPRSQESGEDVGNPGWVDASNFTNPSAFATPAIAQAMSAAQQSEAISMSHVLRHATPWIPNQLSMDSLSTEKRRHLKHLAFILQENGEGDEYGVNDADYDPPEGLSWVNEDDEVEEAEEGQEKEDDEEDELEEARQELAALSKDLCRVTSLPPEIAAARVREGAVLPLPCIYRGRQKSLPPEVAPAAAAAALADQDVNADDDNTYRYRAPAWSHDSYRAQVEAAEMLELEDGSNLSEVMDHVREVSRERCHPPHMACDRPFNSQPLTTSPGSRATT